MSDNQEGKAEGLFKNFGKKVDQFVEELNEANDRLSQEFKKKYDELKDSAEKLKEESKNKERWDEVEESLHKAAAELKNAFQAAFKKRDEI